MIGDYVIETRLGEIRQLPQSALGYCNVEDYIIGRVASENPTMVQLKSPPGFFKEVDSVLMPLSDMEAVNEYYYGWKSVNKNIRIKLAELILGRKILGTRKK